MTGNEQEPSFPAASVAVYVMKVLPALKEPWPLGETCGTMLARELSVTVGVSHVIDIADAPTGISRVI